MNQQSTTERALLPAGCFTREDASAVVACYSNVAVEDDQGTHFRLVMRYDNGQLIERGWNFQPDGGDALNRYLESHGKTRKQ